VAEGSAHVDEDGNLWDAHWDCARRAELERRARDAGPSASDRSLRGRIGSYTGGPTPKTATWPPGQRDMTCSRSGAIAQPLSRTE